MRAASSQAGFIASLVNPRAPVPQGVTTMRGRPDAARFDVYRNNVMVSLIAALEQKFPVSRKIVGDEFFREMARKHVRRTKPLSPLMFEYGDDFPDFIAMLDAAASVRYLVDVARLEVLWTRAYHAADRTPIDIAAIASVAPEVLASSRIIAHPAAAFLHSNWPAGSIWEAHQTDPVAPLSRSGGEMVLVVRPYAEVKVHILPPVDRAFATALFSGASLADAAQAAGRDAQFDFGRALVGLVSLGAICGLEHVSEGDAPWQ